MRRLPLLVSNEIDDGLNAMAARHGLAKTEVIVKAFSLLALADHHWLRRDGTTLAVVRDTDGGELEVIGKVQGLF
ncbi:hypothetical protein [Serratia rhizosphaerae]|uniref:hypothetical protein n=1 Tax=Serratia rhizosphaerae TaxID=2597702 RepID=UPI002DB5E85B|nr:hypothetical protein [Serratia rhizosphaerae]MEB6336448.1 hypothetical protein [Serratia rhizosphaerae]